MRSRRLDDHDANGRGVATMDIMLWTAFGTSVALGAWLIWRMTP
jgi:hypothetical protein